MNSATFPLGSSSSTIQSNINYKHKSINGKLVKCEMGNTKALCSAFWNCSSSFTPENLIYFIILWFYLTHKIDIKISHVSFCHLEAREVLLLMSNNRIIRLYKELHQLLSAVMYSMNTTRLISKNLFMRNFDVFFQTKHVDNITSVRPHSQDTFIAITF